MKAKIISVLSSIGALIWGCLGGSCGLACVAGGCCGGYAVFGFLGLSSSTLTILGKLTPVFLALTVLSLAYAFYVAYKPKPAECCSESSNSTSGSCCTEKKKPSFFKSKTFLWITTVMCLIMWVYPLVFSNNTNNLDAALCCPSANDTTVACCPTTTSEPKTCCPAGDDAESATSPNIINITNSQESD